MLPSGTSPIPLGYNNIVMAQTREASQKPGRKPGKRWKTAGIILAAAVLVLLTLWFGLRAFFFHSFAPSGSSDLSGAQLPIQSKEPIDPDIHNFLLIGTDSRFSHGSPMEGNSDTIIVATYNAKNKSYALTSIMRDAHVPVFGLNSGTDDDYDKLKGAFRIGGIGCLINTVNSVFGLDIQKYVVIGLEGFIRVIDDVLGGIDVELTQSDIAFINNRITDYENESALVKNAPLIHDKPGMVHLTGAQALIYVRNRSISYSDDQPERFTMKRHVQKMIRKNVLDAADVAYREGRLPVTKSAEELRLLARYRMIGTLKADLVEACARSVREHPLLSGEEGGDEYDRAARQQGLLKIIYRKFLDSWTVSDIPGILRICSDTIETNLTPEEIVTLAIPLMDHEQEIHMYSVPFEDTWEYGMDGSGIVFDYEETAEMLHEVLYD